MAGSDSQQPRGCPSIGAIENDTLGGMSTRLMDPQLVDTYHGNPGVRYHDIHDIFNLITLMESHDYCIIIFYKVLSLTRGNLTISSKVK